MITNELFPLNDTMITTAHQSFDMVAESPAAHASEMEPIPRSSTSPSMRQGGECYDALTHLGTEQLLLFDSDVDVDLISIRS